jgi:hypothetical protein
MTEDGMPASTLSHPIWCDPGSCSVTESQPYGSHQSASRVVPADPPASVVTELHLVSTMRGLSPAVLLLLEFGVDDDAIVFPLTLSQAHELRAALDKLLAAA